MHPSLRLTWVGLSAALLVGCGDPLTPEEVAGTYPLVTVNGENLPYTVSSTPGFPHAIEGAVIALNPDGQFLLVVFITIGQGQVLDFTGSGTYTLGRDTVRLAFQGTDVLTGTIVGDLITISQGVTLRESTVTNDGDVLVFEKLPLP